MHVSSLIGLHGIAGCFFLICHGSRVENKNICSPHCQGDILIASCPKMASGSHSRGRQLPPRNLNVYWTKLKYVYERILNQTQICIWSGPELIRSNKHTYTYYVYVCLFDRINYGPLQKPFSLRMFGTPKRGVWGGVQNVLTEKGVWRRVLNDLRTLRVKKVSNAGSRTTS